MESFFSCRVLPAFNKFITTKLAHHGIFSCLYFSLSSISSFQIVEDRKNRAQSFFLPHVHIRGSLPTTISRRDEQAKGRSSNTSSHCKSGQDLAEDGEGVGKKGWRRKTVRKNPFTSFAPFSSWNEVWNNDKEKKERGGRGEREGGEVGKTGRGSEKSEERGGTSGGKTAESQI